MTLWYGPDTYMGENLHNMLSELAGMTDEQIRAVHPEHDQVILRGPSFLRSASALLTVRRVSSGSHRSRSII